MNNQSFNKIKTAAFAMAFGLFSANGSFAQETPSNGTQQPPVNGTQQTQPVGTQQTQPAINDEIQTEPLNEQTPPVNDDQTTPTKGQQTQPLNNQQQTQPKKDQQPTQSTKPMQSNDDKKQMGWNEYKQDLKAKYQNVMDEVDNMRKQAADKKVTGEFTEALDRFEARARVFADHLKNTETIPADKQEAFRSEMKDRLNQLNQDFSMLKERWASINK